MKARVLDPEIIRVLQVLDGHEGNQHAAAKELRFTQSTISKYVKLAKERGLTAHSKILTADELHEQIKLLERKLLEAQEDQLEAGAIRRRIYQLAEHTPEPPGWLLKEGTNGFRGTPMLLASDWHYGEVVRAAEVAGVNEFNAEIAKKRIRRMASVAIDLAFNHMGKAKTVYPGVVLALGGDMISGNIHDELRETNDRTPQQAVNDLSDEIAGVIDALATKFGKVFVPCVTGNHGRSTMKPYMKRRVVTSYEWNIYCNLEREFRDNKHIQFAIPEQTDILFKVYGHRFLMTHGDNLGVRGGDGIIGALGPIRRGEIKVRNSEAQIGRDFDTIMMGHWHQYITLPGLIVNNSLKGYDEYARQQLRAPYSRPSQAFWFTHPEHGITAHWQIYLEDNWLQKAAAKAKEWIAWAA